MGCKAGRLLLRESVDYSDRLLHERKPGMLGEVPEIRVSRDERCVVIEAGLRDQSISESCPPLLSEDSRPGGTGSLPEAGLNLERGKIENELCHLALQSRSTQDLGEDDRR